MQSFPALRRLHARGAMSRGLTVDQEGVSLGPDCMLVRRTNAGYRVVNPVELECVLRYAFRERDDFAELAPRLGRIARALESGDLAKAQILGLQLPFDELDDEELQRLELGTRLIKTGYDPSQPRDEDGRWTSGGAGGNSRTVTTNAPTSAPIAISSVPAADSRDVAQTGDIEVGIDNPTSLTLAGFNDEYHNAVRDDLAASIHELGGKAITEVSLNAFLGVKSQIDILAFDPKMVPPLFGIEVKTGFSSRLTISQAIVYPILMVGGNVRSNSPRLPELGLKPGSRLPPIPVVIYWKPAPEVPGTWEPLSPEFVKMLLFAGIPSQLRPTSNSALR